MPSTRRPAAVHRFVLRPPRQGSFNAPAGRVLPSSTIAPVSRAERSRAVGPRNPVRFAWRLGCFPTSTASIRQVYSVPCPASPWSPLLRSVAAIKRLPVSMARWHHYVVLTRIALSGPGPGPGPGPGVLGCRGPTRESPTASRTRLHARPIKHCCSLSSLRSLPSTRGGRAPLLTASSTHLSSEGSTVVYSGLQTSDRTQIVEHTFL